jgi:hypothetical protein
MGTIIVPGWQWRSDARLINTQLQLGVRCAKALQPLQRFTRVSALIFKTVGAQAACPHPNLGVNESAGYPSENSEEPKKAPLKLGFRSPN